MRSIFDRRLTIKDLLDIDETRISKSKNLEVKLDTIYNVVKEETWFDKFINFFKNKPKLIYYKIIRYKIISDSGNEYSVFIKVSPSFTVNKFLSNKVQIFCSCPDFKFRSAYQLNKKDNLFINKAIKEHLGIALTTPPTRVDTTVICKHCYAAMLTFRKNLKSYNLLPH